MKNILVVVILAMGVLVGCFSPTTPTPACALCAQQTETAVAIAAAGTATPTNVVATETATATTQPTVTWLIRIKGTPGATFHISYGTIDNSSVITWTKDNIQGQFDVNGDWNSLNVYTTYNVTGLKFQGNCDGNAFTLYTDRNAFSAYGTCNPDPSVDVPPQGLGGFRGTAD